MQLSGFKGLIAHRTAVAQQGGQKLVPTNQSVSWQLVNSQTRHGQARQQLAVFLGMFKVNVFKDYLVWWREFPFVSPALWSQHEQDHAQPAPGASEDPSQEVPLWRSPQQHTELGTDSCLLQNDTALGESGLNVDTPKWSRGWSNEGLMEGCHLVLAVVSARKASLDSFNTIWQLILMYVMCFTWY